ncbi:MAG: hypothetical protein ACRDSF_06595, partial [Pseudonocardiaceae bacterium]
SAVRISRSSTEPRFLCQFRARGAARRDAGAHLGTVPLAGLPCGDFVWTAYWIALDILGYLRPERKWPKRVYGWTAK